MSARDYVHLPTIPDDWKVLDIGPGHFPLRRADVFVDRTEEFLIPMRNAGKTTIRESLEYGLPMIPDKTFDFVWCSHVLEHLSDPIACAATISRIGKSGVLIVPSVYKDTLFNFEELEHQWHIMPSAKRGGPPRFIRPNAELIATLRDNLVQKAADFLLRSGSDHECTAEQHLRTWFDLHEPDLDVVVHWNDKLEVQVVA